MSLKEYIKKRSFSNTPEPKGIMDRTQGSRFVVQRHQASRLHYDLRLEMGGVLKSWAVPKGPSMNPKDKRLSIRTEDHPVKYLSFRGTIPKGNYGAGEMEIWDGGRFQIYGGKQDGAEAQLQKGNVKIEFFGKKLKGKFALVLTQRGTKENEWLLIKKKDRYATDLDYDAENFVSPQNKKGTQPKIKKINLEEAISPMLATPAKKIFNDPEWIFELKWDGYRMLSHIMAANVSMYSRNGQSFDHKFSLLKKELETIPHDVILDGEVVIVDKDGIPDFQKLQKYTPDTTVGVLRYYVFDMLHLNGHDTHSLPLAQRKSLIPEVLEGLGHVLYCDHIETLGKAFYEQAVNKGLEGVIAKKKNSVYVPGHRSEDWLKIKASDSIEAIICGYTESGGAPFGSLILGMFREGELSYVGNCGTGFSASAQRDLLSLFQGLETGKVPFPKSPNLKGRKPHWIIPELICEVKFSEWTKNGVLRHPSYKGLREDKTLGEITTSEKKNTLPKSKKKSDSILSINGVDVPITHPEKIYWPESGLRKYDLVDYYIKVSDTILPYLKDRPQSLHRHPNGINSKGFFQKDQENVPDWAETISLYSESADRDIEYLLCQNEATLLYMANLGCIELNPWNSRTSNLQNPDYTVIDIDPSDKNTFEQVIETALAAKEVLELAKIEGHCKTSGSRGLHVYIPLDAKYSYGEARDFTKLLCYYIEEKLPKLTSTKRPINDRKGKIYLDYLQNRRGQTLAATYCVRPKKGAPVSAPISWEELEKNIEIRDFTIHSMPRRLQKIGDLFEPVLGEGIHMEEALLNLGNLD